MSTDLIAMSTPRSEPLSIESLLQKQKDEKESASKVQFYSIHLHYLNVNNNNNNNKPQPKFLTKEERAKLAIAKRAQEIREEAERRETTRRDRDALEREADELAQRERNNKYSGRCQCYYFIYPVGFNFIDFLLSSFLYRNTCRSR